MSARFEYLWEPTEQVVTDNAIEADSTTGLFYDILHVEQTNEGWLAVIFEWFEPSEEDIAPPAFEAVDEDTFGSREEAVEWCETKDVDRYEAQQPADEDWDPDWDEDMGEDL